MRCISRITDDTYSQKFGDGYHKFYVEMRCNMPCTESICSRCSKSECKTQYSRKFDHGTINDPIPDISHIYGSKWYNDSVKKYGEPTKEVIEFAEKYQPVRTESLDKSLCDQTVVNRHGQKCSIKTLKGGNTTKK